MATMEPGNTEAIKKFVEAGPGLSVTSWFVVKGDVRTRRLTAARLGHALSRQIGIGLCRDRPRTPPSTPCSRRSTTWADPSCSTSPLSVLEPR